MLLLGRRGDLTIHVGYPGNGRDNGIEGFAGGVFDQRVGIELAGLLPAAGAHRGLPGQVFGQGVVALIERQPEHILVCRGAHLPEHRRILGGGLGPRRGIAVGALAINDETKLKILYNKEHDERMKTIRSKAGMPLIAITSMLMVIAAIVAGYFNIVVFYTLVIAVAAQLSVSAMVKLYCMKTM